MEDNYKLARWLDDELEGQELIEFESSSEFETYQKIKLYSAELKVPLVQEAQIYDRIMARANKPKVISIKTILFRVAAVFILVFGLVFGFNQWNSVDISTSYGEELVVALPDGSEIHLNSGSTLQYKKWNWLQNKKIEMDGEAFLKVNKGDGFEVVTHNGNVQVLGTQFNVKNRKNRFEVGCYEGKVAVFSGNHKKTLTEGMQVGFENKQEIGLELPMDVSPPWMLQKMTFENQLLIEVLEEMERKYNITLTCENEKANLKRFTGTLPTDNLQQALEIISQVYQLKVNKSNNTIVFQ